MTRLTPEQLLRAYSLGVFPMARNRDDPDLHWIDPTERGILPLYDFHIPKSLKRTLKRGLFKITCDHAFEAVILGCAEPGRERQDTWINKEIVRLFADLHRKGFAHSVECWHGETLVGGLYGLALGGAFFGESMFSRADDASKVALVHLVARLRMGGFTLLDTQFVNDHLARFGAIEIARDTYHRMLADALKRPAIFYGDLPGDPLAELLSQSSTQIS
jgi:leucyl/phenylalanyl-tRNA--protein transferase